MWPFIKSILCSPLFPMTARLLFRMEWSMSKNAFHVRSYVFLLDLNAIFFLILKKKTKKNSDLMQNALIVPLKILKGHEIVKNVGVTCCKFHPNQPWLFTSGADSTIRLYSN